MKTNNLITFGTSLLFLISLTLGTLLKEQCYAETALNNTVLDPVEGEAGENGCCGVKIKIGKCVVPKDGGAVFCKLNDPPKSKTSCRGVYGSLEECQRRLPYKGPAGTCAFSGMGSPQYCEVHEVIGFDIDKECRQIPGSEPHRFACYDKPVPNPVENPY